MRLVLLALTCTFLCLPYFGTTTFTSDTSIPNIFQCGSGNYSQMPQPVIYDCAQDCLNEHGATGGSCNGNQVCVCNFGVNSANNPRPITLRDNSISVNTFPIQQCKSNCSTGVAAVYQLGCDLDCKCNHGATNGTCDYLSNTCKCNYPATATFNNIKISSKCAGSCGYEALVFVRNLLTRLPAA